MTRLVALDTSSVWGGVALLEGVPGGGSRLVAEAGLLLTDSHAAHVLALLEALLAEAGWPRSELDGYAAARGPGSFTGIRMALGTVRGLGLASSRPCLGIGTLDAMAEAFGPAEGERVPVLPAGRGDFFAARFDPVASPPATVVEPWLGPPSLILEGGRGEPVVFGPGAQSAVAALGGGGGWRGIARRAPTSVAAAVGRLALARLEGGARDGEGLSPLYLRPPDAELPR